MTSPGLIIAAPASGSGKTVLTLSLLRHLSQSGLAVASAKTGPDYIDPAFHAAATGRACINLDPWAMRGESLDRLISHMGRDAELLICEGVMGLFDGAASGSGSSADLAVHTGWPVVLVVDSRRQGASAAAVVRGFASHRNDVKVAGVVFNNVASARHGDILREATVAALPEVPVLGCVPHDPALTLPERHLGLVQAAEHPRLEAFLETAAQNLAAHVDTGALVALARPARASALIKEEPPAAVPVLIPPLIPPLGQRIAVARDEAFAFSYAAVLEGWRGAGAELSFFSPLAGEGPGEAADAVYLPGGYPELHGGKLAASTGFLDGLRAAAERGAVIFGECGGYMVLGGTLVDGEGVSHAMAGLLPLVTTFAERSLHLGYREARLVAETVLGAKDALFRGHEFHYAGVVEEGPGEALFTCHDARGEALGSVGLRKGTVMGSFIHLIDKG
ncbi:MAG: cobyrinate a,c-diamide synthase [Alphaproteobacteria bacterium]|nr:cobyrinate a,c-diamide synthase [Alphaproteobacteria bacterium]